LIDGFDVMLLNPSSQVVGELARRSLSAISFVMFPFTVKSFCTDDTSKLPFVSACTATTPSVLIAGQLKPNGDRVSGSHSNGGTPGSQVLSSTVVKRYRAALEAPVAAGPASMIIAAPLPAIHVRIDIVRPSIGAWAGCPVLPEESSPRAMGFPCSRGAGRAAMG
jgi:hypothetical protein